MIPREPVSLNAYLGAFQRVHGLLPGQRLGWLRQARQAAIERFVSRGFPTRRDEDWKYINLAPIAEGRFSVMPSPSSLPLASQVKAHALRGAHLVVFVNGQIDSGLSRVGQLPPGTILRSLAYTLEHNPAPLIEQTLAGNAPAPQGPMGSLQSPPSAFSDLNLAFMADGLYLKLPAGAVLERPIQLLFLTGDGTPAIQTRNIVEVGDQASVCLIEHYAANSDNPYFTNAVTDIVLGAGAQVIHYKLEDEDRQAFHIAQVTATQAAGSRFVSGSIALGGRLARTGIDVRLDGEGASCELDGLYLADGHQHLEHYTRIDHRQPRCTSSELYKGILDDAARAVFNGRIVVHPDAQKSDASQANHNLLLSANSEIDTQPRLEIHADDVRCSHGATVGSLDDEQIFYLRTRGLDLAAARALLTQAFAREIVDRIHWPPLQDRLLETVQARLARH